MDETSCYGSLGEPVPCGGFNSPFLPFPCQPLTIECPVYNSYRTDPLYQVRDLSAPMHHADPEQRATTSPPGARCSQSSSLPRSPPSSPPYAARTGAISDSRRRSDCTNLGPLPRPTRRLRSSSHSAGPGPRRPSSSWEPRHLGDASRVPRFPCRAGPPNSPCSPPSSSPVIRRDHSSPSRSARSP